MTRPDLYWVKGHILQPRAYAGQREVTCRLPESPAVRRFQYPQHSSPFYVKRSHVGGRRWSRPTPTEGGPTKDPMQDPRSPRSHIPVLPLVEGSDATFREGCYPTTGGGAIRRRARRAHCETAMHPQEQQGARSVTDGTGGATARGGSQGPSTGPAS